MVKYLMLASEGSTQCLSQSVAHLSLWKKKSQGCFRPYSKLESRDSWGGKDYSVIGDFGGCEGHGVHW